MTKKKKNGLLKDLEPTFTLAGGSIGASMLGGAINPLLPAGTTNPLTSIGTTTSKFVGPMATLSAFGMVTKQLKKTQKKIKGGKK